jgi:hypothetical protein
MEKRDVVRGKSAEKIETLRTAVYLEMVFLRAPISFTVPLSPHQLPPVWREECPVLNCTYVYSVFLRKLHSSVPMIKVRFSKATSHRIPGNSNIRSHSRKKFKFHSVQYPVSTLRHCTISNVHDSTPCKHLK